MTFFPFVLRRLLSFSLKEERYVVEEAPETRSA